MAAWHIWLRSLGSAIWQEAPSAILGLIPFGENVGRIAERFWNNLREGQSPAEDRAALEQLVNAPPEELAAAAADVAEQVAPEAAPETRRTLALTLGMAAPVSRRALTRADDTEGKTLPAALSLTGPLVLGKFIPPGPPRFREGQTHPAFGNWVLRERLGVGGFSEVWRVQHPRDESLCAAVKFFTSDEARSRLNQHEVAVLSQVRKLGAGTGIVRLEDFDEDADPPWIRFEYVSGGDLIRHARQFFGAKSTSLIQQLAEIVGKCHRLTPPVVHRDLKPGNVLRRAGDARLLPVIADFGIGGVSSSLELDQARTTRAPGALPTLLSGSHTALYASPQQVAGEAPDPRDDVYALGVMWYQLAVGDLSSPAPSGLAWVDELKESGFAPGLVRLLAACIEPRKEKRPSDAADLAQKIVAAIAQPVVPPPVRRRRPEAIRGLTEKEIAILLMLAKSTTPVSKGTLWEQCGATSAILGAVTREGLGVQGGGLAAKGYIESVKVEGERQLHYIITTAGREALKAAKPIDQSGLAAAPNYLTVVIPALPEPKSPTGERFLTLGWEAAE